MNELLQYLPKAIPLGGYLKPYNCSDCREYR